MREHTAHRALSYCIAAVWLVNGLFCKVLNLVPRHQQIVAKILGAEHSRTLVILIGLAEVTMAAWILSGYKSRLNTIAQLLVVASMNSLEFILAPELLLWGRLNALFAFFFLVIAYTNEFYLNKKLRTTS